MTTKEKSERLYWYFARKNWAWNPDMIATEEKTNMAYVAIFGGSHV